ncbi:unnamed protein product [Adineta ricciae]|uniref:G-protein coupled receptors family 1 profile domain-containing protein n=1 Tax=Adineta ricciae TaxID=249248 RepID=A0A813P9K4_ADIRI|nr:unnamed protein product [Adineta ricciae]CAF1054906.1 unnamed protein product [Adineta ricciae]
MSTNVTILIASIQNASTQLNRYFSIVIFIFGVVGNVLNCIVLFQQKLRTNSCAFLLLISSISSLISILSGLTTRMLSGYAVDLTNTIDWLCELRAFVLFASRTVASWLLAFASADRWLSSSINHVYRRKSSLTNSYRSTCIVIAFSALLYAQVFYCYKANLLTTPLKCYGRTTVCRITTDLSYAIITIIVPIIGMITFGLKTVSNVRNSYRRVMVGPATDTAVETMRAVTGSQLGWKRSDFHLLVMLLVQIVLYSFFTLPQAVQKIYSTFTEEQIKPALQSAVENLIFNLLLLLTYFSSAMPFYINILCGGKIFRRTFVDVVKRLCKT